MDVEFKHKDGKLDGIVVRHGADLIAVPACVAGLGAIKHKFGTPGLVAVQTAARKAS